jgi:hypothetical protein
MSSSENPNWQSKIEQIETEINAESIKTETVRPHREIDISQQLEGWVKTAINWFDRLPQTAKVVVGIAGVMMGFSVLNSLLHLISSLVSIGILGFILYFGYKYWLKSQETK